MSPSPTYSNPFFHQEPAHPGVIRLHDDLVSIYKMIREAYQPAIDRAFDEVSQQIGYVVLTTLPIELKTSSREASAVLAGANLRGTIFEKSFQPTMKEFAQRVIGNVSDGTYTLYLIWYEALKLKLHTDWMEPAHLRAVFDRTRSSLQVQQPAEIGPGIHEPAHWFDAAFTLETREALVISAIDEVYPELRLVNRIEAARQLQRTVTLSPGIREPAHFRQLLDRFDPQTLAKVAEVIEAIQKLQ